MTELDFQKKVFETLSQMKKNIETLRKDFDYFVEYIEDTKLTDEERKQLHKNIDKVKVGDILIMFLWMMQERIRIQSRSRFTP